VVLVAESDIVVWGRRAVEQAVHPQGESVAEIEPRVLLGRNVVRTRTGTNTVQQSASQVLSFHM
jgi:hypothetical protein